MQDQSGLKGQLSIFCQNLKLVNQRLRFEFQQFALILVVQFLKEQQRATLKGEEQGYDATRNCFRTFFDRALFDQQLKLEDPKTRVMDISIYALVNLRDLVFFLKLKQIEQKVQSKSVTFTVNRSAEQFRPTHLPNYFRQLLERNAVDKSSLAVTISAEELKHLASYEALRAQRFNTSSNQFKEASFYRNEDGEIQSSLRKLNWRLKIRSAFIQSFINRADLTTAHPDVLFLTVPNQYCITDFVSRVLVAGTAEGLISVFQSRSSGSPGFFNSSQRKPEDGEEGYKAIHQELKKIHDLRGHEGPITALTISYDEYYCLSSSMDYSIRLWCLRLGSCIANYRSHSKVVWSLRFSETGLNFLSGSADCSARLWRTDIHHALRVYQQHSRDVMQAMFLKNSEYFLTASLDKTIRIWDVKQKSSLKIIRTLDPVSRLAMDYSGQFLVTAEDSGQMVLWDLTTATALNVFNLYFLKKKADLDKKKARVFINDMDFSVDGKVFACCSKKEIAIFNHSDLLEKPTRDIGQSLESDSKGKEENIYGHIKPRQVLDIGKEARLVRTRFHPLNHLVVLGIQG